MSLEYFDDLQDGETRTLGSDELTKAEIIEFAEQFDPQPVHIDEAAAASSSFEGIVASNLHTMAICQRLVADGFYSNIATVEPPSIGETWFLEPARPGDTLTAHIEITETRRLADEINHGVIRVDQWLTNQEDATVVSYEAETMVAQRN